MKDPKVETLLTNSQAVSVSLPSWKSTVGYEEGEDWVLSKMKTGYPRFFIHKLIQKLANKIVADYGSPDQTAILFPSKKKAELCVRFLKDKVPDLKDSEVRILSLVPVQHADHATQLEGPPVTSNLSAVLYPAAHAGVAKQVWQHSGDGVSSRRAEFCYTALEEGLMVEESATSSTPPRPDTSVRRVTKGPRRYQRGGSLNGISIDNSVKQETSTPVQTPTLTPAANGADFAQFIEERYGRNLSVQLEKKAKLAVRRRIAGCLKSDIDLPEALSEPVVDSRVSGVTEADVSLYPNGMSSIFNTHQLLLAARGPMKSICFGFPYIDTLKILQKWGPGCQFYGNGVDEDLDDLEKRLESGERYLALFTEFPGNPLLRSPNLARIRALADRYDFAIVVDETVGNFVNVNVLRLADVVVSSLTKVFSGDSNVMGGSSILNPNGRYYPLLKKTLATEYEDNLWAEDAVFLERNSRDYLSRIERINFTANALANLLNSSPLGSFPRSSPPFPNKHTY